MKHLFTVNLHNEVVIFADELDALISKFTQYEPCITPQKLEYYEKKLKKCSSIVIFVNDSNVYTIQRVY